jgi:hypothetical protein
MDLPHTIVVSEALYEYIKAELADDIYVYKSTTTNYSDDLAYKVDSYEVTTEGKAVLTVRNDKRIDIYSMDNLGAFDGVLNGYDLVTIESISSIDDSKFSVTVSGLCTALSSKIEKITSFGLKLSNSVFYSSNFFTFPSGYKGARINYKTFGINVSLLITAKDDASGHVIESITQKIYDTFFYLNNGTTPLEIDGKTAYLKTFGNFNTTELSQNASNLRSKLVTIAFSYTMRYQ